MKSSFPIIQSQFAPPPIRQKFIQRSHVNKKLTTVTQYPLTIVYAGAGYGKSTALSLFFQRAKTAVSWYTIAKNDDDIYPFILKLIYALKTAYPSFGEALLGNMKNASQYFSLEQISHIAASFINEMMDFREETIIVLDDYHHVAHSIEIEHFLLFLIEHMPTNLHIVLSTRRKPKWESLSKLRVQGDVLEISQYDLVFSPDEMTYILEEIYQIPPTKQEISKIYQITEGWAIAFHLIAQQIKAGNSLHVVLNNQKKSLKDLFDYLATEVLSRQSFIIQQFLIQSSILDYLSPELCDEILEINASNEIIKGLIDQNLFIVEGDNEYYRYHALFKRFLENMLKRDEAEYIKLHRRVAFYYERKGKTEQAIYHFMKIEDFGKASVLLSKFGKEMLESGRLQTLYDLLQNIPIRYKQEFPILFYYQGEVERYRSRYENAKDNYEKAFERTKDSYLASVALEGIARIYLDTIQPDQPAGRNSGYAEERLGLYGRFGETG